MPKKNRKRNKTTVNKMVVHPVKLLVGVTKINLQHLELLFVAVVLVITGLISDKGSVEWLGVLGVLLTFEYTIIANHLGELYGKKSKKPRVNKKHPDYHDRLLLFYYFKEVVWFSYFIMLGAWSALVGVVLFLLYAVWRREWRKYHEVSHLDYID